MIDERAKTTNDGRRWREFMRGRRWSAVEKRKTLTTKAQRHQGKIHREVREEREKRFSPQRSQRAQRGKDARQKHRGHGEKRAMVCGLSLLDLGPP
jgi:hypothetical protein